MGTVHHLTVAVGSLVAGILFAVVSAQLARRETTPEVRFASLAFAIAWGAFSFEAINDALRMTVGVWILPDTALYFSLARLKILAAAAAIWGFGVYVIYLWTGRSRISNWILLLFATTHAFLFLYLFEVRNPVAVEIGTWVPRMVFANPSNLPPGVGPFAIAYFFLPPIVLALLYFCLVRRLQGRTQRFRVTAVAGALILFHVTNLFQANPDTSSEGSIWPAIILLNLLAGTLAYIAYRPPAWVRQRLKIVGVDEEGPNRVVRPRAGDPSSERFG